MALTAWGFIYTAAGSDPGNETVVDTGACRSVFVGVGHPEQAIDVARRLVDGGAQLIELCGGFGPVWTARVIEAVHGAVPVGAVGYGAEAVDQVHAIFS
ncbi:hypothetical protein APR11_004220 [Nocardia amikacinitolerans]|uniref:DUF6506 family protein n=1 Tax=Nocardia amikacinitolerans TaxID=756689 RepID=UPI0020A414F5|nr:DUF6506 family protein [Nocardia amikacinitolerans]MCP2297779.1 hypothetical protein [Nocardia amikacinitolerans]